MNTIKEDLLHYLWKTKNFDHNDIKTTDGQEINILSYGNHNDDAGPDFLNAKIQLDGTTWVGHIEIHLKASDWLRHKHDKGYQNVILHVVMEADIDIALSDGTYIPCLELKSRVNHRLIGKYQYLQNNKTWVPCVAELPSIPSITKEATKNRALAQRLTKKANEISKELIELNNDINELIYQRLAWAFGLKVNAEAMLTLAKSVPYKYLQKHKDELIQIEALLFGQAGLLPKESGGDPYVELLIREYQVMQSKFGLKPMPSVMWKFSRLRPPSFPTIRIAQLSKFIHQVNRLDDLIFSSDIKQINQALKIKLEGYWLDHYRFGPPTTERKKNLGDGTKSVIIINAVVPILFMYGIDRQSESHKELAIEMLDKLPSELNAITRRWTALEMTNESAADSQALLELKRANCDQHLCMSCPIGHKIISD